MDYRDLNREQIDRLYKLAAEFNAYINGVDGRLRELGFEHNDQLRSRVANLRNSLQDLRIFLHYCNTLGTGIGRRM